MRIEAKERCGDCKYVSRGTDIEPCSECYHAYVSMFEPKNDKEVKKAVEVLLNKIMEEIRDFLRVL